MNPERKPQAPPEEDLSGTRILLRTAARDKRKALEHYQDLRRSGRSKRAVVISEDDSGLVTILGQMLKPEEIAHLLFVAATALQHADQQRTIAKIEARIEPDSVGEKVGEDVPERMRGLRENADGVLVPPTGETIISCGRCNHPRFYATLGVDDHLPARLACAHCKNELIYGRVRHQPGHA